MTPELDAKLVAKYPKIFADRNASMQETAMCWGFSCNDGWYWLIDELCAVLQWDTDKNGQPQVVATQVKEKFGTLRFYTQGENDGQRGMIRLAQSMSARICECCGSTRDVEETEIGWVKTLCGECRRAKD